MPGSVPVCRIIHRCSRPLYRGCAGASRLGYPSIAPLSLDYISKDQAPSITNLVSIYFAKYHWTPVRMLYYLQNEDVKEYKKYPSLLDVTQTHIKDVCFTQNPVTAENWDNVKVEIMNHCLLLTEDTFDSVLMHVLLEHKRLDLAQSFMSYMNKRNFKPNFVTLCKYMVLCSANANVVGQDVILETYNKVVSVVKTSVLNEQMVEFLVRGLCATDEWRKALDHTKHLPHRQLTNETLNALACAAFRHGDHNLALDILRNWYKNASFPGPTVFVEYMKSLIQLKKTNQVLASKYFVDLVEYTQNKGGILKQDAVAYMGDFFRSSEWTTNYSKVSRDGVCSSCGNKLEVCTLTKEEFHYLKESFLRYSVQKSDIFINTNVEEFNRYKTFVNKFRPFDIVLDGLNVAHAFNEDKKSKNLAEQLFYIVDYLSKSLNRVLVLGRSHMKRWPVPIMRAIRERSFVFYVANISEDDPFLIYAALASGPDCKILSMDMMRDHIARLPDPQLIHLFKKWQQSHQVYLTSGAKKDELVLMGPIRHSITMQGSPDVGYHVPFNNDMKREPYEELNNWLCIHRRT